MDKFNQVIRDYGAKAGLTGATIAVGSMLLFGQTGNIKVFNMNVPAYLPIGIAGGTSSIVGDIAHDYILPHIPQVEKMKNLESAGLNFLTTGGAFVGSLMVITGVPAQNIPKAFIFVGGTKLVVDGVYDKYVLGKDSFIFK